MLNFNYRFLNFENHLDVANVVVARAMFCGLIMVNVTRHTHLVLAGNKGYKQSVKVILQMRILSCEFYRLLVESIYLRFKVIATQ